MDGVCEGVTGSLVSSIMGLSVVGFTVVGESNIVLENAYIRNTVGVAVGGEAEIGLEGS